MFYRPVFIIPALLLAMLSDGSLRDSRAQDIQALPGTGPLTEQADFADKMLEGLDKFMVRRLEESVALRSGHWTRDFSSPANYIESVGPNRERFRKIIGLVDTRVPVEMELTGTVSASPLVGKGNGYDIFAVRWTVLKGVDAEGLLLQPGGEPSGNIVALPDCDNSPEMLAGLVEGIPEQAQFARRLAENNFRVLVPALINRDSTWSGTPRIGMTNQPHREFIWRAAFQLGHHIIGYEVQKVLAAVDWFRGESREAAPVGVIGYGEGGLVAFYAGAVDLRIDAVAVLGYFQPREEIWKEPVYRNVWGLLEEFGDAEIAGLVAPRPLIIEACKGPEIVVRRNLELRRTEAAPGVLTTPTAREVEREVNRARALLKDLSPPAGIQLINSGNNPPGGDEALQAFITALGVRRKLAPSQGPPQYLHAHFSPEERQKRQFLQMLDHTQLLMREAKFRRAEFWSKADNSSLDKWVQTCRWYRDYFWDEIVGRFPPATVEANPRTRLVSDQPRYQKYQVVLDVYPGVFAYGILLVPKDLAPGERRPVVVCQHGIGGTPDQVTDPDTLKDYMRGFGHKLAERGFVVYAPQNPYIGEDKFRQLARKMSPLKKTIFAFIVRQHECTLNWLARQPFVDPERIAFYGISYGGKTALHVPPLLDQYCLSICSADFNEWTWKMATIDHGTSFMYTREYEMFEFDLANTFNHAEMSWMILPRPFMVERGHLDGVAPDEWVAYEYARTRRLYDLLGIGERTEIEFFNGPHIINGKGTFEFLYRHLKWRPPEN